MPPGERSKRRSKRKKVIYLDIYPVLEKFEKAGLQRGIGRFKCGIGRLVVALILRLLGVSIK
jgi:hypothetical protein